MSYKFKSHEKNEGDKGANKQLIAQIGKHCHKEATRRRQAWQKQV